jgi:predicted nucleotidyltransferase
MAESFQPAEILNVLERHGVEFVLIGGLAAAVQGSPFVTTDIDVTPRRARKNLERLSAALKDLDARIRTDALPEGIPFDHDANSLAGIGLLNLVTRFGDLDISLEPVGTTGYEDLVRDAKPFELGGVRVLIASLADVIRSKEAAGRDKDRLVLPTLRRLLEESRG